MPIAPVFARSIIIAAIIAFTADQCPGAPCGNFEFPRVTDEQIFSQFEGAILRIEAGTKVGTGFLIDAKQGFILTAAHVVSDLIDNSQIAAIATSPALPKQEFRLRLIKDLTKGTDKVDMALLQIEPSDILSFVIPIDVSFRAPQAGTTAYAIGYSRMETDPSKQSVTITKIMADQGIVVKASSYPGDSGSPLLSNNGMAIGVTRARIDGATAHYTPMSDALGLLRVIPITTKIRAIDDRIRAKTIEQDDLSAQLRPGRTSSSARNVELVSWASYINGSSAEYTDVHSMFSCPIVPAFWQRALDDAAELLRPIMTPKQQQHTRVRLAENANILGRASLAAKYYASAFEEEGNVQLANTKTVFSERIKVTQALTVIESAANSICYNVSQGGEKAATLLNGTIDGVLASLNITGSGQVRSEMYQGIQTELAVMLHNTQNCKKSVFDVLATRMLPSITADTGLPISQSVYLKPRTVEQPSIDCKRATDPIEKLICADADLALWDGRMMQAYWERMGRLNTSGKRKLKESQIEMRDSDCNVPRSGNWNATDLAPAKPCILQLTRQRAAELANFR